MTIHEGLMLMGWAGLVVGLVLGYLIRLLSERKP